MVSYLLAIYLVIFFQVHNAHECEIALNETFLSLQIGFCISFIVPSRPFLGASKIEFIDMSVTLWSVSTVYIIISKFRIIDLTFTL